MGYLPWSKLTKPDAYTDARGSWRTGPAPWPDAPGTRVSDPQPSATCGRPACECDWHPGSARTITVSLSPNTARLYAHLLHRVSVNPERLVELALQTLARSHGLEPRNR